MRGDSGGLLYTSGRRLKEGLAVNDVLARLADCPTKGHASAVSHGSNNSNTHAWKSRNTVEQHNALPANTVWLNTSTCRTIATGMLEVEQIMYKAINAADF